MILNSTKSGIIILLTGNSIQGYRRTYLYQYSTYIQYCATEALHWLSLGIQQQKISQAGQKM